MKDYSLRPDLPRPKDYQLAGLAPEVTGPPAEGDDLHVRLARAHASAWQILESARKAKNLDMALKALARLEKQLELEARLLGMLREGSTVNVLVASPDWLAFRSKLVAALRPYPEAMRAVEVALTATERPALTPGGGK